MGTLIKESMQGKTAILMVAAVLLMPINWLLESLKWKTSLSKVFFITIKDSFKAILFGISIGILTPGRIGEYGGRVLAIPAPYNAVGTWATLICSLLQNLINIFVGLTISFFYFNFINVSTNQKIAIWGLSTILLLIIFFLVFNFSTFHKMIKNRPWLDKLLGKYIQKEFFNSMDRSMILRISMYSLLRYVVYSAQYILFLLAMQINLSFDTIVLGVAIIFFLQTIIPLTPIISFSVRGGLAIFVFSQFTNQEESLTAASYLMWIVNLFVPAFIGMLLLYRIDFYKAAVQD